MNANNCSNMHTQLTALLAPVRHYDSWIAFDCETTGLPPRGRLIELGAIHFNRNQNVISEFHEFAKPPHRLPQFITQLTGIRNEQLRNAPPACDVIDRFVRWLPPDVPLIAHNICFDLQILAIEVPGCDRILSNRLAVDSLTIARSMHEFPNCRLETIAHSLNAASFGKGHRVLTDARVVQALFLHALSKSFNSRLE
ncbi:MAG: 3'-5' exonuclease [Planctomycetaceae bacterium]